MTTIALDAEAGQVSAELARRGIAPQTRVHVEIQILDELPMPALMQEGRSFDWLSHEPDLYSDQDVVGRR